ncbi:MAG: oxidoreductase [Bryobacterales bacterium]|nr:oxidoreductase [Bryobacterales bacterium]
MRFPIVGVLLMALPAAAQWRIVTVDPGHFHAGLFQKEALPELAPEAFVYAPLSTDLTAHLNRIAGFNTRKDNPTQWRTRVYAGADYWERFVAEHPGQVVVFSGRNRGKIDKIDQAAQLGMHVLGDKPWIIEPEDMPKIEAALAHAKEKQVALFDGMTQRYEVSCALQKELVITEDVFGTALKGSLENPGVYMESVHFLLKLVAGNPNLRPAWFFDIRQQGEGLTDVGTHVVDLVQWTLAPNQAIDYRKDIEMLSGERWPTVLTPAQFQKVTGVEPFPDSLSEWVKPNGLNYFCNNRVNYKLRGVHVKLDVKWDYEAAPGTGDTELAIFRGSLARVELRQGKAENFRPEVFVVPNRAEDKARIAAALDRKLKAIGGEWPGLTATDKGAELQINIPDKLRIGHEAHFAVLAQKFLSYAKSPATMPAWETPYMLAKYYVTTQGVALARRNGSGKGTE